MMLRCDRPLIVDLAVANGQAYRQLNFISARLHFTAADKPMTERHVIACGDTQIANTVTQQGMGLLQICRHGIP